MKPRALAYAAVLFCFSLSISADDVCHPGYTWTGDTDTGIFHSATNTVGVTAGCNETMSIFATGVRINGSIGVNRTPATGVGLAILQNSPGPIAGFDNASYANYLHFTQNCCVAAVDIGAMGSIEANIAYNMYYANSVHQYYDSNRNAVWWTINNDGAYLQFAPSGYYGSGDVWSGQGSQTPFRIDAPSGSLYITGAISLGALGSISSGSTTLRIADSTGDCTLNGSIFASCTHIVPSGCVPICTLNSSTAPHGVSCAVSGTTITIASSLPSDTGVVNFHCF